MSSAFGRWVSRPGSTASCARGRSTTPPPSVGSGRADDAPHAHLRVAPRVSRARSQAAGEMIASGDDVAVRRCRSAVSDGQAPGADRRRAPGREGRPRRDERAPARRAHGRFLVQPLQRLRQQGRRALVRLGLRARSDPPVRARASSPTWCAPPRAIRRCSSTSTTGSAPGRLRRSGGTEPRPEGGAQRELRARADGAAHARRRRRLHAEGRHRGRARASPAGRSTARGSRGASSSGRACTTGGEKVVRRSADPGRRRAGRRRARDRDPHAAIRRPRASSPTKLVASLRLDTPPPALVDRVAGTYTSSGGDIPAMLRAIFASRGVPRRGRAAGPRSRSRSSSWRARCGRSADGIDAQGGLALARASAEIGEPLYLAQPPTGYSDRAEVWVNSGALLARMNFALALALGTLSARHGRSRAAGRRAATRARR